MRRINYFRSVLPALFQLGLIVSVVIWLVAGLSMYVILAPQLKNFIHPSQIFAYSGIVTAGLWLLIIIWLLIQFLFMLFRKPIDQELMQRSAEIDDNGLQLDWPGLKIQFDWNKVYLVTRYDWGFMLFPYTSTGHYSFTFPNEGFASEQDREQFWNLASRDHRTGTRRRIHRIWSLILGLVLIVLGVWMLQIVMK